MRFVEATASVVQVLTSHFLEISRVGMVTPQTLRVHMSTLVHWDSTVLDVIRRARILAHSVFSQTPTILWLVVFKLVKDICTPVSNMAVNASAAIPWQQVR